MGTLTNQNYERLQESLTTTNIVQKKLIEVVNNKEQSIQRIQVTIERYTTLFDYLVIKLFPSIARVKVQKNSYRGEYLSFNLIQDA
jgi:hypothetical protein